MSVRDCLVEVVVAVLAWTMAGTSAQPGSSPDLCEDHFCIHIFDGREHLRGVGDARCQFLQDLFLPDVNELLAKFGYLTQNFTHYPDAGCYYGDYTTICGDVAVPKDKIKELSSLFRELGTSWLSNTQVCNLAALERQMLNIGTLDYCTQFTVMKECMLPFPFWRCTTSYGPQLTVSPVVSSGPGRKPTTALHCFTFQNFTGRGLGQLCRNDLYRADIWADDKYKRNVRGVKIILANQTAKWVSTYWGPKGQNSLNVAMKLKAEEAVGSQICYEVDTSVPLRSFCLNVPEQPNTCYISLVESEKKCCPLAAIGPLGS